MEFERSIFQQYALLVAFIPLDGSFAIDLTIYLIVPTVVQHFVVFGHVLKNTDRHGVSLTRGVVAGVSTATEMLCFHSGTLEKVMYARCTTFRIAYNEHRGR